MIRATIILVASLLLSGCETLPVNWPTYNGYVADVEPDVRTINEYVIERLRAEGLEAEHIDRGIIVYLPPNAYFSGGKSDISEAASEKIAIIAKELNKQYLLSRQIEVSGHTNSLGARETNMSLSKNRAEAAVTELISSSIDESRVTAMWFGETKPRYSETKPSGKIDQQARAKNRRVEFVILNPIADVDTSNT